MAKRSLVSGARLGGGSDFARPSAAAVVSPSARREREAERKKVGKWKLIGARARSGQSTERASERPT